MQRLVNVSTHVVSGEAKTMSGGPSGVWPPTAANHGTWPPADREGKEKDSDVNYFEAQLPRFHLPAVLVTNDGTPVTTSEQWHNTRRPEILSLFRTLVHGRVPESPSPLSVSFQNIATDTHFLCREATRKDVWIVFANAQGERSIHILVFSPNHAGPDPAPAFL